MPRQYWERNALFVCCLNQDSHASIEPEGLHVASWHLHIMCHRFRTHVHSHEGSFCLASHQAPDPAMLVAHYMKFCFCIGHDNYVEIVILPLYSAFGAALQAQLL